MRERISHSITAITLLPLFLHHASLLWRPFLITLQSPSPYSPIPPFTHPPPNPITSLPPSPITPLPPQPIASLPPTPHQYLHRYRLAHPSPGLELPFRSTLLLPPTPSLSSALFRSLTQAYKSSLWLFRWACMCVSSLIIYFFVPSVCLFVVI